MKYKKKLVSLLTALTMLAATSCGSAGGNESGWGAANGLVSGAESNSTEDKVSAAADVSSTVTDTQKHTDTTSVTASAADESSEVYTPANTGETVTLKEKVRSSTDGGYGIDYKELTPLKILANKMEIAILLVHHTRKSFDADPFNMISGTTGISGCADVEFVLQESQRGSRKGKLICVGRDIENQEICVAFDRYHWVVTDSIEPYKRDMFALAVHDLMLDERSFVGSATALCELLSRKFGGQYFANRVTRDLIQHTEELASLGVKFTWRRSHGCRIIELAYDREGDGSFAGAGNLPSG